MRGAIILNNKFLNILWILTLSLLPVSGAFAVFRPFMYEFRAYRYNYDELGENWATSQLEATEFWCEWVIVAWASKHSNMYPASCQVPMPLRYIIAWKDRYTGYISSDQDGLYSQRQAVCPSNSYRLPDREWCSCNPTFHEKRAADGSTQCTQYTVSIAGSGSTMALPSLAGPIVQEVSITDSDGPVQDMPVSIEFINLKNNAKSTVSGTTMAGGKFSFIYTPPYFNEAEIALNATCEKCQNVASKTISVIPAEAEPQMCRR